MAGIGFSINKLLREKELSTKTKALSYAVIVTTGPLLLGELVLVAIYFLSQFMNLSLVDRNLIVTVITYGLIFSLLVNGVTSLGISRYVSDKIFEKDVDDLLSTYFGSQLLVAGFGGALYGIFLLFSGIGFLYGFIAFILFLEFLSSWNAMNFLMVSKNYIGLFKAFLLTVLTTVSMSILFALSGFARPSSLLLGLVFGYASFLLLATYLLSQEFPKRGKQWFLFDFLKAFDQHFPLVIIGMATQLGLTSHIIITWFSGIGQRVRGLFFIAPYYDLTVFLASLTMFATLISYTVVTEVHFFKAYRHYYRSLSEGANLQEIKERENQMTSSLVTGLRKTAIIQLLITLVSISIFPLIFENLPLGFNDDMIGYFKILCLGYGVYGIANMLALTSLYFGNFKENMRASALFAGVTTLSTIIFFFGNPLLYGFGFLIGSSVYFIYVWMILEKTMNQVMYQVLGSQSVLQETKFGFFSHLADDLNQKAVQLERSEHEKK